MKKIVVLLLVVLMFLSVASVATANSVPGGPWIHPNQTVKLSSIIQPEELEQELLAIEARAVEGRMELEQYGVSNHYEWPIYVAKFGDADTDNPKIFIDTQIHGDEILGTHAVLNLIREFATSSQPEVEFILENVTVWFLPMLNPDGGTIFEVEHGPGKSLSEATSRRNIQFWDPEEFDLEEGTPAPWYWATPGSWGDERRLCVYDKYEGIGGYDINRDSHPSLVHDLFAHADYRALDEGYDNDLGNWGGSPGFRVTPEARAVRDAFMDLEPCFYINHHHMGTPEKDGEMTTLTIQAQFVPVVEDPEPGMKGVFQAPWEFEGATYSLHQERLDLSNQVNYLVYDYLTSKYGGSSPLGNVTQFPRVEEWNLGWGLPGTTLASHSMSANYEGGRTGAGVMLYEVRGQADPWSHTGQKSSGMLIRQSEEALYETLRAFATGEVFDIDPDLFEEEVPSYGTPASPPWDW